MASKGLTSPIECGICMETYSTKQHVPKSLPCGHTFCNICLENLNKGNRIICPNDNKRHSLPTKGVQGFPNNISVLAMLDYACANCSNLGNITQCPHCPLQLCASCLDDHAQSEFRPAVEHFLDEILAMKQELCKVFMIHVESFNEMMSNIDQFAVNSKVIFKGSVKMNNLRQVQDKLSEFKLEMKNAKDFINQSRLPIDPELPCFDQVKSSVRKRGSMYKKTRTSRYLSPKTKTVTSSHRYPATYSNVPRLVFGKRGNKSDQFNQPRAAAVDVYSEDIHIADYGNSRICVYDKDARYKSEYDVGDKPRDLCFISNGDVAVSCEYEIRIFGRNRLLRTTIGKKGKGPGEFWDVRGMTVDKDDLMYVSDMENGSGRGRVNVLDRSGSVVRVLNVACPVSVALHPHTEQVYVAESHNLHICIFSHDGQEEMLENDINFSPLYVCFRDDGLLCITDCSNECIHLRRDGRLIQTIGKYGSAPGQFNRHIGTTFTNRGDLVVCDTDNNRVQIFS